MLSDGSGKKPATLRVDVYRVLGRSQPVLFEKWRASQKIELHVRGPAALDRKQI